jgi:hypothetical protein
MPNAETTLLRAPSTVEARTKAVLHTPPRACATEDIVAIASSARTRAMELTAATATGCPSLKVPSSCGRGLNLSFERTNADSMMAH